MDCANQHQSIDISDLSDLLYDLVDIHVEESTNLALGRVLQCIFTLVRNKNVNLGQKVFEKLIAAMLAASNVNGQSNSSKEYRQFVANVLACLQLQVRTFPSKESNMLLQHLWSLSLNTEKLHPLAPQILFTLFDDFNRNLGLKECPQLLKVIQQLISSNKNKERQVAFFLMHKLKETFELNIVAEAIMCSKMQWSDYTAALEHLEEQQMPLNLITFLENTKSVHDFFPWLRILYLRLLQSENVSVLYETVKYIINQFNVSHLTDWNILEEFLRATNRTQLYNVDDDNRSYPFFKNFVSKSTLEILVEALASVTWEWHSLPLWEWIGSIPSEKVGQLPYISKETLLKLASRIRGMEKSELQYMAQGLITNRFESSLDNMSLGDYLLFIETMYSRAIEYYSDHDRLKRKILNCDKIEAEITHFTKARLAIIFNLKTPTFLYCDFLMVFMDKLRTLSKVHHGWLRFFLMPCIKHYGILVFYSNVYGVETSLINRRKDLKKLQQHLLEKLLCETDEEKSLTLELSVDLFVTNQIKDWNEIEKLQLKPLELLEQGGKLTFKHLCYLLGTTHERLKDENVLPAVVALLKKFPCSNTARNIGTYAAKHLTPEEQNRLSLDIIENHFHGNNGEQFITSVDLQSDHVYGHKGVVVGILDSKVKVPLRQVIQGIIHCSTLSEDAWIEANYLVFYGFGSVSSLFMSYTFEQPESFVNEIVKELLYMNMKLSESHSNYLRNSKEHRVKFCIALALMYLGPKYECSDMLWSALYSKNDQFNIILMYEVIVAESLRNADTLIERLQSLVTLEPNQQLSLLSVTNIFLKLKWNTLKDYQIQKIIEIFLMLAIQEISQVRQFAKMILCKITEICKDKG
ncbi:uncharacterized protein LOC111518790 isoform X2 [Drosophila willistoni]|nr:uncharacterized protein LOC111518790 isoform X2 [Drosophila willistoni]